MTTETLSADQPTPFAQLNARKPHSAKLITQHIRALNSQAANKACPDTKAASTLTALQACHQAAQHQKCFNPFELTTAFFDALHTMPRGVFIGDIQGELGMLIHFITWLETVGQLTPDNTPKDHIVLLGDMISRGGDSCGVITYVQHYLQQHYHCTLIMGNAEARILNMRADPAALPAKDLSVIQSYFPDEDLQTGTISRLNFLERLQQLKHTDFFNALTPCARVGPYLLSHSGDLPYKVWQAKTDVDASIKNSIHEDATRFYYNNGDPHKTSTLTLFNADTLQRYYHYERHHQALGFPVVFGHVTLPFPTVIYHEDAIQAVALDTNVNGISLDQHTLDKRHQKPRKMLSGFLPHLQHTCAMVYTFDDRAYNGYFHTHNPDHAIPLSQALLTHCEQAIRHYRS